MEGKTDLFRVYYIHYHSSLQHLGEASLDIKIDFFTVCLCSGPMAIDRRCVARIPHGLDRSVFSQIIFGPVESVLFE